MTKQSVRSICPLPSRRDFLRTIGTGAAVLTLTGSRCSQSPKKRPNILFILADDLGYGDPGCYGQQVIRTPNIDSLAAEGMRFTQHYAGSTVCAPSRASLMTGLHTGHTRIRGNHEIKPMGQYPLAETDLTMAELLQQNGYRTGLIGKWGLGYPGSSGTPNKKGFDYFFGYLCQRHAHNYYPEFLFRNADRIPLEGNRIADPRPDGAGVAVERTTYAPDLFVREALNFLETSGDKPFFLMLTFTLPHANNEAGDKGMEIPDYGAYAETDWPDAQKGHAAMISRLDRDVGTILEKLRDLGLEDDTLVIFSSDNGPHREGGADPDFFHSSGPLRGIKRDLYEGGIRVPMIARWPHQIQPGAVSGHISAFWDMMPTFAEAAGLPAPAAIDGVSFLPLLLGHPEKQREHKYLYWEFPVLGGRQAIRMGKWKAVRLNVSENPDAPIQLFDLEKDIGETTDISGQHPDLIQTFKRLFVDARNESELFPLFPL
ncbi:arylsulfatase [bacterium]|nr:arylsulfatase [bacterium]